MLEPRVTESYFWGQVKGWLNRDSETHAVRIENAIGVGVFDVNACYRGNMKLIELKVFNGYWMHVKVSQRLFAIARNSAGGAGDLLVLARNGKEILLYDGLAAVNSPHTVVQAGKSFRIRITDLPEPLYKSSMPIKVESLMEAIFR